MRLLLAAIAALVVGGAAAACSGESAAPEQETICDPGENIFCRCPGGDPGTKQCRSDGMGFEACVGRYGECAPGDDPSGGSGGESSGSSSDPSGSGEATGAGGSGSGGEGGAGTGTSGSSGSTGSTTTSGSGGGEGKALFEPCVKDADCASQSCPMGYCTKGCQKFDDCPLDQAECVTFQGSSLCMPKCDTQNDCNKYGPPSECGFTKAVDGFPVFGCADWLGSLALPPEGANCKQDDDCHLGHAGKEFVCAFGACTTGCYEDFDCPLDQFCPSQGALASCE